MTDLIKKHTFGQNKSNKDNISMQTMGNLLLNIRGRLPWWGGGDTNTGPHGPAGILSMCTTSRAVSP